MQKLLTDFHRNNYVDLKISLLIKIRQYSECLFESTDNLDVLIKEGPLSYIMVPSTDEEVRVMQTHKIHF